MRKLPPGTRTWAPGLVERAVAASGGTALGGGSSVTQPPPNARCWLSGHGWNDCGAQVLARRLVPFGHATFGRGGASGGAGALDDALGSADALDEGALEATIAGTGVRLPRSTGTTSTRRM